MEVIGFLVRNSDLYVKDQMKYYGQMKPVPRSEQIEVDISNVLISPYQAESNVILNVTIRLLNIKHDSSKVQWC